MLIQKASFQFSAASVSFFTLPSPRSLLHRCCDVAIADSTLLRRYFKGVVGFHHLIKNLLDTAYSARTRSWYTQSLRVVQAPNARYPFEVNMHDDAVLKLLKKHKGIEGPRADLNAQQNKRLVEPMKVLFDRHNPKDVSIKSTDGQTIISGLARPHSARALLAFIANSADASPYSYIGLSCKRTCYAFFRAYNRPGPNRLSTFKGLKWNFTSFSFFRQRVQ
ncbi:hypothetical protein HETIRDRAFT_106153 [Heterobasidion irregulare TC 32-1]|uniref:Uncharacterized protein n=1 Tax=Heterobasidion irregulare (strain TC 32-1) TaxID=747525 RepID=W4JTG0_HETIT|nr:uncharacterized protein HETIRDRAFT_106153 [Heterobasidion irregulare TC 32-1]ETW76749.1 hypothetical protein HETIRDRAFT_106153 [Heterobasidion irregulare TC 32-1]